MLPIQPSSAAPMQRRRVLQRVLLAAGAVPVLIGCSTITGPGGPMDPPSGSATHGRAASEEELDRLREGLVAQDSYTAELLDRDETTVRAMESPFPLWSVLHVSHRGDNHPLLWTFVVNRSGEPRVINLAAEPQAWGEVLEGVEIASGSDAVRLSVTHLELTHDAQEGVYLAGGVDDVHWLPTENGRNKDSVANDRERVRGLLHEPRSESAEGGWTVSLTAMHQTSLVAHRLRVAPNGQIVDRQETLAEGLATRVVR